MKENNVNNSNNVQSQYNDSGRPKEQPKAVAAMVLAILGWFIPLIGIILTIIGLILGISARRKNKNDGFALAAIIIASINLALTLLVIIVIFISFFSFVDHGALLPNRADLTGSLRALPAEMVAYPHENKMILPARYTGTRSSTITEGNIELTGSGNCEMINYHNVETSENNDLIRNGHITNLEFECPASAFEGEYLEGTISIKVLDSTTNLTTPSSGMIRYKLD
ncbi:MAG: DUF4190 domain-containing protein [Nanoarchaeota archaeon]